MTPPDPDMLSIVIPLFNERDSLKLLVEQIDAATRTLNVRHELFFVDDGSTDDSWTVICKLAASDERIAGLRFRRNFGKAAALAAGFARAFGSIVMTLDADLQDDPAEIPRFLAQIQAGCDVVSGWKKVRHDPWHKVAASRLFNGMVSRVTGVRLHDHNCGFKAYRAEVVRDVRLYGELHRFVPVLAAARGFTVGELAIHHRPRQFGRSKFGARRFLKGFFDLLSVWLRTGFGYRPLHLFGAVAAGSAAIATLLLIVALFTAIPYGVLIALGLLLFAGQSMLTGLTCEFVLGRTATHEPYLIAAVTPPNLHHE